MSNILNMHVGYNTRAYIFILNQIATYQKVEEGVDNMYTDKAWRPPPATSL